MEIFQVRYDSRVVINERFFAKQFIHFIKRDTNSTENKSLHTFNKYDIGIVKNDCSAICATATVLIGTRYGNYEHMFQ